MVLASLIFTHAALCLDFTAKLALDCAQFCYVDRVIESSPSNQIQALKLIYPENRRSDIDDIDEQPNFMDYYVKLMDVYEGGDRDHSNDLTAEMEIVKRLNNSLAEFVEQEGNRMESKRTMRQMSSERMDYFEEVDDEGDVVYQLFDFDIEEEHADELLEELGDTEIMLEHEISRPPRRRRRKFRRRHRRPQTARGRRFRGQRRRPRQRRPNEKSERRRGYRQKHHGHGPHHPQPHPVPHTTTMRHVLLSFLPAFLSIGGLLGFGVSTVLNNDNQIADTETNTFTFTPTITIEGDTQTNSVTNTDTNTNTNTATNTDNDVFTSTNSNSVAFNVSTITILINTINGTVTINGVTQGATPKSFDFIGDEDEVAKDTWTLETGSALNARITAHLLKKFAELTHMPFVFDIEEQIDDSKPILFQFQEDDEDEEEDDEEEEGGLLGGLLSFGK